VFWFWRPCDTEVALSLPRSSRGVQKGPPNKRLKLAGAVVPTEAVVSCPSGHGLSSSNLALAGESPAA